MSATQSPSSIAISTAIQQATPWSSWLREPLLHFVLLGAVLFAIDHFAFSRQADPRSIVVGAEVDKEAKQVESHMRRYKVLELTADRASQASRLSSELKMPMADSIIYAAALECKATLWTQDDDFKGKRGVKYFALTKIYSHPT